MGCRPLPLHRLLLLRQQVSTNNRNSNIKTNLYQQQHDCIGSNSNYSVSSSNSCSTTVIIVATKTAVNKTTSHTQRFPFLITISIFLTGFTGYVQQINGNRKSGHGSNHYFDIFLQVSEDTNQMIRVMTNSLDDTGKLQLFRSKQQAQQPISISNLRVASSGMIFMHNNSVVKDITSISLPFKYAPPAALPLSTIADITKNKKTGDSVTVSGTIKWDGEEKTPNSSKKKVRDGKLIDSSGVIDISIWENHIQQIKEGEFYKLTNCKVKYFFGKKISTCTETEIELADKQDITQASKNTNSLRPHLCCPEIQNVNIETNAICNTKGCKAKITGNSESKKMVRCTSCNRAMLVKNCYMEMNTTFQLETPEKQYTAIANASTLTTYLGEDVYKYKDNVNALEEKLLLLENVDFTLATNARMITQIVDHQQQPEETKDNPSNED